MAQPLAANAASFELVYTEVEATIRQAEQSLENSRRIVKAVRICKTALISSIS